MCFIIPNSSLREVFEIIVDIYDVEIYYFESRFNATRL